MKRTIYGPGIALAATLLALPPAQASEWAGSSLSLRPSSNGMFCSAGAVRLSIDGDSVYGSAGNGISLAGKLAKNGSITLSGGTGAKRVSFTGKVTGQKMRGGWIEALTGCGGTWKADKVADSPPPPAITLQPGADEASIYMEDPDEAAEQTREGDTIEIPAKPGRTDRP